VSATRDHTAEIDLAASPERVFAALVRPSAIREWWSAARAIVVPRAGGVWAAAWGAEEDSPDYVTTAVIRVWQPPRRLVLGDYDYVVAAGPLPFAADFTTSFEVLPKPSGARLRVTQAGFPAGPEADEFYAACETGWRQTLEGLRRYLEGEGL
jgi:uncharacterized protein YndB with AHSA1/START domain